MTTTPVTSTELRRIASHLSEVDKALVEAAAEMLVQREKQIAGLEALLCDAQAEIADLRRRAGAGKGGVSSP